MLVSYMGLHMVLLILVSKANPKQPGFIIINVWLDVFLKEQTTLRFKGNRE